MSGPINPTGNTHTHTAIFVTWFDGAFQGKAIHNNLKSYPSISPASLCALINHSGELKLIKGKTNRDARRCFRETASNNRMFLIGLPPSHLSSFIFDAPAYCFHRGRGGKQMKTQRERLWEREERGRINFKKREEADLWEDYGICVTIKPEGNAADTFAKRESFSAETSRLQRAKTKADKKERIWRGYGRRLHADSVAFLTSTITESANRAIQMEPVAKQATSSALTVFWQKQLKRRNVTKPFWSLVDCSTVWGPEWPTLCHLPFLAWL